MDRAILPAASLRLVAVIIITIVLSHSVRSKKRKNYEDHALQGGEVVVQNVYSDAAKQSAF